MNDRFRFRAIDNREWSDEKGKIYYDVQDAYDWIGGEPEIPATSFGCIVDGEGWVVEQCTGLKDKNGRLIYEGDILALPYQAGWRPILGVVKFNEKLVSFLLEVNEATEAEQSFWWNKGKEVVGNIHENPELLEDK